MADKQQWQEHGRTLALANKRHQWERADWILEGIDLWGDSVYAEAERIFVGYARGTFIQWAYVARAFPQSIRIDSGYLTFGHYQAVMGVNSYPRRAVGGLSGDDVTRLTSQEMRLAWLRKAAEERWTVSVLRAAIINQVPEPAPSAEQDGALANPKPPSEPAKAALNPFKPGFPLSIAGQKNLNLLAIYRRVDPSALVTLAVEEYLVAHTEELQLAESQQSDAGVWERVHRVAKEAGNQISVTNVAEIRRMYEAEQMSRQAEAMAQAQLNWTRVQEELKNERFRRMVAGSKALGKIKVSVLPLPEPSPDDEPVSTECPRLPVQGSESGALPKWEQGLEAA